MILQDKVTLYFPFAMSAHQAHPLLPPNPARFIMSLSYDLWTTIEDYPLK